jgi:hypothetical protein
VASSLSYGENKQLGRLGALAQQIICFTITSGASKVPTNKPPAPLTGQEERIALARHFVGFHNGFGIILKLESERRLFNPLGVSAEDWLFDAVKKG